MVFLKGGVWLSRSKGLKSLKMGSVQPLFKDYVPLLINVREGWVIWGGIKNI